MITVYDFLAINKSMLEVLSMLPIDIRDVKYLDLYKDYMRLASEGHKKTYIMQYLSDEYNVNERTIYRVIKKLSTEVEV